MKTLLGIKKDMTQVFAESGSVVPVTVVDIAENVVIGPSANNSENLLVGYGKKKNPSKSELGQYKKLGFVPELVIESIADSAPESDEVEDLTGKKVNVTGRTKGKGFQGVMKRWGFKGGKKTHGQSDRLRAPGSIGSGTTPGRVWKGKKMAGRVGNNTKTVENLEIVKHLVDEKIILIKGALPGAKNSKLIIRLK